MSDMSSNWFCKLSGRTPKWVTKIWFRSSVPSKSKTSGWPHRSNNFTLILDSGKLYNEKHAKLLVVEPHILVSCSTLAEGYTRMYKLEKYKKPKGSYKNPAVFGKMIHLIFQKLLGKFIGGWYCDIFSVFNNESGLSGLWDRLWCFQSKKYGYEFWSLTNYFSQSSNLELKNYNEWVMMFEWP